MKNKGWICLHRKIMDDPMWMAEPFTRAQAWIDLLLLANHRDGYIIKRGIKVTVKRGQVGWSQAELAKRWSWSRGKTARFFQMLANARQIRYHKFDPKNGHQNGHQKIKVTTLITIINYERYQGDGHQNGHQTDIKRYRNNNNNNDNKKNLCPQQQIVDLYHEKLPELPKVKIWSEQRKAALRARWNQAVSNNNGIKSNCLEWWAGYFDYIRTSDFLMGRIDPFPGKSRFLPNLEWLIKKQHFVNILEGKYHRN
jgi:hypothetical protein